MKSIKMATSTILFLALMLLQFPIFADGNKLLNSCELVLNSVNNPQISGDRYTAGFCLGFIQGVHQLNSAYQYGINVRQPIFCAPPEGISNGQAIRIVTKYLQGQPGKLHDDEIFLVIQAFKEAFPCDE